jgi:heme exporter protein D
VLTDAFKLSFAATLVPRRPRLLLLFSDQEAAAPFRSPRTWSAAAIRQAGIEVLVVTLPEQERAKIRDAQRRQDRRAALRASGLPGRRLVARDPQGAGVWDENRL